METETLSGAARQLMITQPTVGRHIDELEAALGGALFTRSQTGLTPTPLAVSLTPTAQAMADAARALERRASGQAETRADALAGTVRITASEIVGIEILPPILADLRRVHPGLVFEVVVSNAQDDLLNRSADIAVRMTPPVQDRLVRVKLGEAAIGLYAHEAYLAARGHPKRADELREFDLIGVDRDEARLEGLMLGGAAAVVSDFSFRCDSDVAQLRAVKAGLGIGVVQTVIGEADRALVRVLPDTVSYALDVWLAMHEDLKSDPCVSAVFALLKTMLAQLY